MNSAQKVPVDDEHISLNKKKKKNTIKLSVRDLEGLWVNITGTWRPGDTMS
jgi:hypothetical protein